MKLPLALGAFAAALLSMAAARAQPIRIDGGLVADAPADSSGVRAFKGLPYAAPPVDALRWRPPQPVRAWSGVLPSGSFGPNCLQPQVYNDLDAFRPSISEDCLYLNVWTPARAASARLPVMVWIHGGGYMAGSGAEPRHDGVALARKGVVVVTLNYRLGVFGFLATPELTAESPRHASGDYGLMDQIAALEWVKRNIAAFGGDPNRVTIFGESAGSMSVSLMMASPLAKGLFQRAIGESGAAFGVGATYGVKPLAEAARAGMAFVSAAGAASVADLRRLPSGSVLAMKPPDGGWRPVVDGYVLPEAPEAIFAEGRQSAVPLLAGWNRDEGVLFSRGFYGSQDLMQRLAADFGANAAAVRAVYPAEDKAAREAFAGDAVIEFPTWAWAAAERQTAAQPTWLYRFDHVPPVPSDWFGKDISPQEAGAYHSGEIPYVFEHPDAYPSWRVTDADRRLADLMSSCWVNFARNGDPNGPGLPAWPAYDPRRGAALKMHFDVVSSAQPDSELARYQLLERLSRKNTAH